MIMWESENLDVSSLLNWFSAETKNDSTWTKYINKVENVSLRWNNLKITLITKRSFWDYICWLFFFVLRCIVISLILLYLVSIFWLNIASSLWRMVNNSGDTKSSVADFGLNLDSIPIIQQTKVVNDYVWLMDELLES